LILEFGRTLENCTRRFKKKKEECNAIFGRGGDAGVARSRGGDGCVQSASSRGRRKPGVAHAAVRGLEWLSRRTTEYRSSKDDAMGVVEDLDELGKLGRGFSSMDDLEKVVIGDGVITRPTYISAYLNTRQKREINELLKAYTCCFAWDYTKIPWLSRSNIDYRLKLVLDRMNREPETSSQRSSEG
jgi:hypothetical protein